MSEKKHIDRLFQERFKDFEASPKEHVWKNIEKELKKKKQRPAIVPIWYKIAGIAAVLAVLFMGGTLFFDQASSSTVVRSDDNIETDNQLLEENGADQRKKSIVVEQSQENIETQVATNSSEKENIPHQINEITLQGKQAKKEEDPIKNRSNILPNGVDQPIRAKSVAGAQNSEAVEEVSPQNSKQSGFDRTAQQQNKPSGNSIVGVSEDHKNIPPDGSRSKGLKNINKTVSKPKATKETTLVSNQVEQTGKKPSDSKNLTNAPEVDQVNKKSLVEVAAAKKHTEEPIAKFDKKSVASSTNWQVSTFAAPIYYDGFGAENALDPSLAQNEGNGEITMSYGINFSYKVSERLRIRSGVNQVSMSYHVNDIAFASTVAPTALNNVNYSAASAHLAIANKPRKTDFSNGMMGMSPWMSGTLDQQLGFIEVPVELEYMLINKKFALSIIGGASTLFLSENDLAINSAFGTTNIGEANNLNHVSFSTNIGLGFGYDITKQFEITLEPMFKYQLNTYTENANGFKPYYLGIYTGIGFKF